jgi:hypothetical protein
MVFLFFSSCTREKDKLDDIGDYFFSGTINGDDVQYFELIPTIVLNTEIGTNNGAMIFTQTTRLGYLWGANPDGLDVTLRFHEKPTEQLINGLKNTEFSFDQDHSPGVQIIIFNGNDLTDNERSNAIEQNGATFQVTEILIDNHFEQEDRNFEIVKAFQLRGSCNFKTENLSVENGEFSIRAVGIR